MTAETPTVTPAQTPVGASLDPAEELAQLKDRARLMGITFSGNIGVDALSKRIADKLAGIEEKSDMTTKSEEAPAKSRAQIDQELREEMHREQMKLVRCRIYNLNPQKADLHGEIITVANRYLGTVTKYIPFGEATENGYHLPYCLYTELKSRQFQSIKTRTVKGQIQIDSRLVPEYQIEILPDLTEAELEELALQQSAAARLGA